MIELLRGIILHKSPANVVIECGGIGFTLGIPLTTYEQLADTGQEDTLYVYLHMAASQSAITPRLFGFKTRSERELFMVLISVQGVGPRLAVTIVSQADVGAFKKAVVSGDMRLLTRMKGIGKKKAEKILFELREKFEDITTADSQDAASFQTPSIRQDALAALIALGYTRPEAIRALQSVTITSEMQLQDIVRAALHIISG